MEKKPSLISADVDEVIKLTTAISDLAGNTFKDLKGLDVVYSQSTCINAKNEVCHHSFLTVLGYIPSSEDSKLTEFRAKSTELAAKFADVQLNFGIYHGLYKGDKFASLEDLVTLPGKEKATFTPKEGEVTVVYFWDNGVDHNIHHALELAQKNSEKWQGKVRVVGVNISNNTDEAVETVKFGHHFKGTEQYHANGGWDSKVVKSHGADFLPAVFVVDQQGVVAYRGQGTNIEHKIDELLSGHSHKHEETSLADVRKLHTTFEELHAANKDKLKDVAKVCLHSQLHLASFSHVHAHAEIHEHFTRQCRKGFVEYLTNVIDKLPSYVETKLHVTI